MTDKDRLIELLKGNLPYHTNEVAFWQDEHIGALADYLIANGVTVTEWRPASEPPKEEGEYIVMIDGANGPTTLWYSKCYDGWYNYDEYDRIFKYDITHWMPLPQPPKEVK